MHACTCMIGQVHLLTCYRQAPADYRQVAIYREDQVSKRGLVALDIARNTVGITGDYRDMVI